MHNRTGNNMKHPIKSFSIKSLFGSIDLYIPFRDPTKILIGENGVGKTQALNIFYYVLTKKYNRLNEFKFESIEFVFHNEKTLTINKRDLDEALNETYNHPMVRDLIDDIGYSQFEIIRHKYLNSRSSRRRFEAELELNSRYRRYSISKIYRIMEMLDASKQDIQGGLFSDSLPAAWSLIIDDALNNWDILYFPTYRRVEEDLHSLGYDDDDALNHEQTLIQFGMDDVKKRFIEIEGQIDNYLKDGFSQITSEILGQLVRGFDQVQSTFINKIDAKDIDIILARVGNKLSDSDKSEIRSIINSNGSKNPSLTYFLNKLIGIYEKQKTIDNSVKLFRDTCNKYLVNKELYYDESAIKIYVKERNLDGKEILLSKLSSGEKQIISILSKVYISNSSKQFIILFDEPELSLGINWQKELLPDMINSKRCDFLLAVTHSPFIFDNELDQYACGLSEYITAKETKLL